MSPVRYGDLIFLVAGEPSGDALGAKLMAALQRASDSRVRFAGVGGERMAAAGLKSLFPLTDIAVMGLTEVLPRLPTILRRLRLTADAVWDTAPAVVVTIDAPSFSLRVADRVRATGIPVVHYVAPQLWAWRPGRARKLAGRVDRLLALLPFEPEFFRKLGVDCTYVGHPVLEDAAQPLGAADGRALLNLPGDSQAVLVMPGSRAGLAGRMLPVFLEAASRLAAQHPNLEILLPTVPGTEALVRAATAGWKVRHRVLATLDERRAAFAAASAALTISGTATLELAVAGVPMVVGYRVNRATEFLVRRMIEVPHVAMPNLILGRLAVPEKLQDDCRPDTLAAELERQLISPQPQRDALNEVCAQLGLEEMRTTGILPSDKAARVVLEAIGARREPSA